ncbi:MAG: hypothetical protein U0414_04760 [Polyangiaceae bacterium]
MNREKRGNELVRWALRLVVVSLVACRSEPPTSEHSGVPVHARRASRAARPPPEVAVDFEFDGFQLGDVFAESVKGRSPYGAPCETALLERSGRRLIMFGPSRCARARFPERTGAVFFLPASKRRGAARDEEPILAFAWFGGSWFTNRSDFPVYIGDPDTSASPKLGPARHIFELYGPSSPRALIVRGHPGDIWSMSDGTSLVGFVAGPMPDAPDEQWRTLLRFYETHGGRSR